VSLLNIVLECDELILLLNDHFANYVSPKNAIKTITNMAFVWVFYPARWKFAVSTD